MHTVSHLHLHLILYCVGHPFKIKREDGVCVKTKCPAKIKVKNGGCDMFHQNKRTDMKTVTKGQVKRGCIKDTGTV